MDILKFPVDEFDVGVGVGLAVCADTSATLETTINAIATSNSRAKKVLLFDKV